MLSVVIVALNIISLTTERGNAMKWTDKEIELIKVMLKHGDTHKEIATELGRTAKYRRTNHSHCIFHQ